MLCWAVARALLYSFSKCSNTFHHNQIMMLFPAECSEISHFKWKLNESCFMLSLILLKTIKTDPVETNFVQMKAIVVKQLPTPQNTADQIMVPQKNKAAYEKTLAHSLKSSVSALKASPQYLN